MIHDLSKRRGSVLVAQAVLLVLSLGVVPVAAAPAARILRIDPRASLVDGAPLLTTVIDLVQHKPYADVTSKCALQTGEAAFDCIADELEKPNALYDPFQFPKDNALFTVTVDGTDMPATFVSSQTWGASKNDDGVGTAWLILIDGANSMGSRFDEAKAVAKEFVNAMGPRDIVNVMYFNDRAVVAKTDWKAKAEAASFIDSVPRTYPSQGRTRPLFNILKQGATDGFQALGNVGGAVSVPMHQAMVVLSNGVSGSDIGSPAQTALLLKEYLTGGRFPEDNQTMPKAPVPIVSIWFPAKQTEEFFQNARQFMENLANPEIGGFHSIVREGQASRATRIVQSVTKRFDQLHIVKWRVSCIAPTVGQTFKLVSATSRRPSPATTSSTCRSASIRARGRSTSIPSRRCSTPRRTRCTPAAT
jgi:hypothetical protein